MMTILRVLEWEDQIGREEKERWREGILGETAKMKVHLKGGKNHAVETF